MPPTTFGVLLASLSPSSGSGSSTSAMTTTVLVLLVVALVVAVSVWARPLLTASVDDDDASEESAAPTDTYGLSQEASQFLAVWDLVKLVQDIEHNPLASMDVNARDPAGEAEDPLAVFPDAVPDDPQPHEIDD